MTDVFKININLRHAPTANLCQHSEMDIILASTSKYRAQLLQQLAIPFSQIAPQIDEEKLKVKLDHQFINNPKQIALELAQAKATSISSPESLIIGGDQLVLFENQILGKPGNYPNAFRQVQKMQNKSHQLITALAIHYQNKIHFICDTTTLKMRPLSDTQIEKYLLIDEPYDCAGSYKLEEHGIALFEKIDSQDFTAIQGIPLIALANLLQNLNIPVFSSF